MNQRYALVVGAITGALAVALGAFGAHALKPYLLEVGRVDTFELAVRYQFYHTFAILFTGITQARYTSGYLRSAPVAFIAGIILFCGSLYTLCFAGTSWVVFVTPVGGVLFIAGWLLLLAGVIKSKG